MNEAPKAMSSKRNIIILVIVLAIVIVGGIIAAVAVGSSEKTDIAETLTLAERYLSEENYEQAIIEFERILEIDPMNVDAYIGKAKALIALGNEDAAKSLLEDAYELTSSNEIKAVLEGLAETAESAEVTSVTTTTGTVTTSTSITETTENVQETVPPTNQEVENMLYDYMYNDGELNTSWLENVTGFGICGKDSIDISFSEDGFVSVWSETYSTITDISFIQFMPNLIELQIRHTKVSDITSLEGLHKLEKLLLTDNAISDITPLSRLGNLTELGLDNNAISDISPLAGLHKLNSLSLYGNKITDISALSELTNITMLEFSMNQVTDISPVSNMTNLWRISFLHNGVTDISPLLELNNLSYLYCQYGNNISDAQYNMIMDALPNCNIE